jgi:integrase
MRTNVWITRPKRKGRNQTSYRLRWREPLVDERGYPVFDERGKLQYRVCQESTGTRDRKTAEAMARQKFNEVNRVELPQQSAITLAELGRKDVQWLQNRDRAQGTIYLSKLAMRYFMELVSQTTPVTAIRPEHIEDFIAARRRKVGPKAVNRELACLRASFNRAVKVFKVLDKNPFTEIMLVDVPERPIRSLSDDEERRLLDACSKDLELNAYVRLALDTGCRAGELSNLAWANLDLDLGTGSVECNSMWRSKTRRNRFIAFTSDTAEVLRLWHKQHGDNEFVFRSDKQDGRTHYYRIRSRFENVVKRSGIAHCTLHDLRRTVGTRLAAAGVNQRVASAVLGHQDIATTARYYQAVDAALIKKAVESIRGSEKE